MPVFGKSEFEEELKGLGLTPAQIKEKLAKADDLEKKTTTLETELTTTKGTLAQVENSFTDTKKRLDALEANGGRRQEPKEPRNFTSVVDDEEKAFDERFADRSQPIAAAALAAGRNSARLEAKLSLQGKYMNTPGGKISLMALWDKWYGEIEKAADNTNAAHLMNAATWLNIFDYVKGKHVAEIFEKPDNFIESVQTSTTSSITEGGKKDEKLNDEELATVKKMGREASRITPEKYQEMKKKMTFVNV